MHIKLQSLGYPKQLHHASTRLTQFWRLRLRSQLVPALTRVQIFPSQVYTPIRTQPGSPGMLLVSIHCPVSVHCLQLSSAPTPHSSPVSFDPLWLTRFIYVSKINPLVSSATFPYYERQSPNLLISWIVEEKYMGIKPRARTWRPVKEPRNRFPAVVPVRQPYLSYRPARLHRLAESIPRNRFLGSINVYKYGLRPLERDYRERPHAQPLCSSGKWAAHFISCPSTPSCLLYNLVILNRKNRQFGQKPKKLKISEKCQHREA